MGVNGSLTGKHYDVIFTDDIVNLKDRTSRAEREHTKSVYMELQNIKNRGGRIVNTMTPWHVDDAGSLMPKPRKWDYTTMPEVMTDDDAKHIKERMTPSLWAANYELRFIPSDDVIFTDPKTGAGHEKVYNGLCHVDAAYGGEDYTAFTAMRHEDGTYYVYGKVWRKHVSDVTDRIKADHTRLMLGRLYIETNGDKGFMARDFKQMGIPVVPYSETMNKVLKIETYLKQAWPSIVFVDGTDQEFINQICDWTEEAEHDDCPDSASSLCRVLSARKRNEGYVPKLRG
jgi:predicted phage terminase large subunit-like protein